MYFNVKKLALINLLCTTAWSKNSYNGLALKPPMGWNSWATFGCEISERLIFEMSDYIDKYHLNDFGYQYMVIDDCWSSGRNGSNFLTVDHKKFPHGMKHVAEVVHNKGLKFGMYAGAGEWTCAGYEGSLGYEDNDAKYFAEVGTDYLKYDNCYNSGQSGLPMLSFERYKKMSDALVDTGRPIIYSICNWGEDGPWNWAPQIANSWRVSGDLYDSFDKDLSLCPCGMDQYDCKLMGFGCSMMNVLSKAAPSAHKVYPGAWNDLDILEVGHGSASYTEYQTHFTMWCVLKSVLLIGADLRKIDKKSYGILTNQALIAVNQDPLGLAARRIVHKVGDYDIWLGKLINEHWVVVLLNLSKLPRNITINLNNLFIMQGPSGFAKEAHHTWKVHDLWGHTLNNFTYHGYNATWLSYKKGLKQNDERLMGKYLTQVSAQNPVNATVKPHGVAAYRLIPVNQ